MPRWERSERTGRNTSDRPALPAAASRALPPAPRLTSELQLHENSLLQAEPEDLVGIDCLDDVLEDAGMLVVGQLGPQVDIPRRLGDFDDQLRRAVNKAILIASSLCPSHRPRRTAAAITSVRQNQTHDGT